MAIRYIVRPTGILTTPKALKEATGAQATIQVDATLRNRFDPSKDVFLGLPRSARVEGLTEGQQASYHQLRSFYTATKYQQRKALHDAGVQVPRTFGITAGMTYKDPAKQYVSRPHYHRAGSGFRILTGDDTWNPHREYCSELFPRKWEYRVIYCHGQRMCTLLKKMPDGIAQDVPWTLANGAFFTDIGTSWDNHRLKLRGAYEALEQFHVIKDAHLCAADVLVSEDSYAVCEINFCPSLKVDSRLTAVAERLLAVRS